MRSNDVRPVVRVGGSHLPQTDHERGYLLVHGIFCQDHLLCTCILWDACHARQKMTSFMCAGSPVVCTQKLHKMALIHLQSNFTVRHDLKGVIFEHRLWDCTRHCIALCVAQGTRCSRVTAAADSNFVRPCVLTNLQKNTQYAHILECFMGLR